MRIDFGSIPGVLPENHLEADAFKKEGSANHPKDVRQLR